MSVDVIIPLGHIPGLNNLEERAASLFFAIRTFYKRHPLKDVRVLVVCQNLPSWAARLAREGVRSILIQYPVFNKSWCINVGVRNSVADFIVIAESDMWCAHPYLHVLGDWMNENALSWCYAWNKLYYTTKPQKTDILKRQGLMPVNGLQCLPANTVTPTPNYSEGGFVAFRREFFKSIGMCNEWMQELGGIDNDIALRARTISGSARAFPLAVYHLWHPRVRQRERPSRRKNVEILNYTKSHCMKMIEILRRQRAGDPRAPYCSTVSWAREIRR
jgi:hypothetical protein